MTRRTMVMVFAAALAAAAPASAQSLVDLLPMLLKQGAIIAQPGQLSDPTAVDPNATDLSKSFLTNVTLTSVPQFVNGALAFQLGSAPLGPVAATVIYARGEGAAMHQTFGGAYADRGRSIGRGKVGLAMTFQNDNYNSLDGADLKGGGINFLFANAGPSPDTSDVLQETVSLRLNRKVTSFLLDYGVSNRIDVTAVIPIVQVSMDVRVQSRIVRVRSSLDTLASCAGVPSRNTGDGPALRLCQDPHGFDTTLTLVTHDTYLDQPTTAVSTEYGVPGKTARGVGDIQLRAKAALVSTPATALAATVNLSMPTGNPDNFLGTGAFRATPGVAWSSSAGRWSPHATAGYTFSHGDMSSALLVGSPTPPTTKVPDEINWSAGLDAAIMPRTTLVSDFVGRLVRNVPRFATGTTQFATGTGVPVDVAAATDLISTGNGDLRQIFGTIGGRFNLAGSVFANGTVMFPVAIDGLKPKPSAAFWIDYAF